MTFQEYIAKNLAKEFKLGKHDCATFCFNWIRAVHKVDVMRKWKRKYASEMDIARLVVESEHDDWMTAILFEAKRKGFKITDKKPILGDFAVVKADSGEEVFAIFNSTGGCYGLSETGVSIIHPRNILMKYRRTG